jgi:serine/threonine protein kinase
VKKTEAPPSRVGEILAEKYRITRYVGAGGMGTVYEAQHLVVGRRFAVKYLHAELARAEETLERFRREARAAGALESENIVSIVDFGIAPDGIPYIVMEFLAGEDLASLLAREGPLPVGRAVNIGIQACRGLDAAHAAGIVHRDLKPENLFICRRGDGADLIKILDFGIAKLAPTGVAGPVTSVTRSGASLGTPFYMPPEQARGAKDIDHRADIYALGVILFEALAGKKPHPGESYNEILYHILTQPALSLATLRPQFPADLVETIQRALAFQPHDRPRSAVELAQALSRHAGRQVTPIRSQFELRTTRTTAPSLAQDPGDSFATTSLSRGRRHLPLLAVGLGLAGAAAWLLLGQQGASPPAPAARDTRDAAANVAPPPRPALAPPDAGPADARKDSRPASTATAKPAATPTSGSPRAKSTKKPIRRRPHDDTPSAPEGPRFDERNPYQ